MMKKAQAGFTLIELMIVVAIIGILAAVALPAYQDYMARAKVSEVVVRLDAAKASVAEFIATNGSLPTDANSAGFDVTNSKYVSGMAWTAANGIEITVQATGTGLDGQKVYLAPSGTFSSALTWTCGTNAANTLYKFLPSNCRSATPTVSVTT